jgi:hypothetical protein
VSRVYRSVVEGVLGKLIPGASPVLGLQNHLSAETKGFALAKHALSASNQLPLHSLKQSLSSRISHFVVWISAPPDSRTARESL